jgi:hypothetical protein
MGGECSTYGVDEKPIQGFGGGNVRERDHLEDPGVDGRIIIKIYLQEVDTCECGNEPSGSVKCGAFLD